MPTSVFHRKNPLQQATVALLTVLLLLTAGCLHRPHTGGTNDNATTEIFLLTTNDLHGRLEPFTIQTNQGVQIAGGFAGLAAQMDLFAHRGTAVLRLNSGDTLTGPYAAHFNGEALFGALSRMNIDAAALGNHELERGPEVLAQALKHSSFPMIATNIDLPSGHVLAEALKSFYLFERGGKRLLVIGLLTPDLQYISSPGPGIQVLDPGSLKIRERIRNIIKQQNPDIVIALTHLGLEKDRQLARHVPDIDVICGGHSHDRLTPGNEITVKHADGRQTVIVQAGAGGSMLGVLRIQLQPGSHPDYAWQPQEIRSSSAQNQHMLDFIEHYRSALSPIQVLTTTDTVIDCRSATLRSREAPIGNFIVDSLREHFNTDVALYNGGGIRGDCLLPAGPFTSMDVETMLPFSNEAVVISMTGAMLRQILERSVAYLPQPWGGFLQVSGLRLRINPQTPLQHKRSGSFHSTSAGQHITDVDIRGNNGTYHPLAPEQIYRIVINEFLARGGNGYYQFKNAKKEASTGAIIRDIIMDRLAAQARHSFKTDGRISMATAIEHY